MAIDASCPKCGKAYRVPDERAGQMKRCLACKTSFLIPEVLPLRQSAPPPVSMPSAPAIPETVRAFGDLTVSPVDSAFPATPERSWSPPQPNREAEDAVAVEWKVGDVILDLYEVRGILGEGGMGKVYKVLHRGWNLELAVKFPRPEIFARGGGNEKFVQEAETWVNLGMHPNIASCFYARTLGGVPRIFAEYVEGGSLEEWITKRTLYEGGPEASLRRILDIAIQFAWGLHFAHEKGLIHQDVKPANVLMTSDGAAMVTDFGLANGRQAVEAGRHEEASKWLGLTGKPDAESLRSITASYGGMTPAYCSPEQARRENMTRRTDLWSWAVSVLEMFTGGVGWMSGLAAPVVLEEYLEAEAEDASLLRMPDAVAELLGRCFQEAADARPHDMTIVADALRRIYAEVAGESYTREQPEAAKLLADALNNRAVSLLDLGRKAEAELALEQALAADPVHLHATYNHGLMLWRDGRTTDEVVRTRMRQATVSHADTWEGPYLSAWIEIERGDEEAARVHLREAGRLAGTGEHPQQQIAAAARTVRAGWHCLRTLEGHADKVNAVSLTSDGRMALSGSSDNTLRVWEVATGRCLRTIAGHAGAVMAVSLTSDGRLALSGSMDTTLRVWEVPTGRCLWTLEGHTAAVWAVSLTPDGRLVVSASHDRTLRVWEVATGRCLRILEGHMMGGMAVSVTADGRLALSGGEDKTLQMSRMLRVWDVATGSCLRTLEGHTDWLGSVVLTSDGRLALSGSWDRTLRVWEVATGRCLRTLDGPTPAVRAVSLTSIARTLARYDDIPILPAECAVGLTSDGRLAVSGCEDRTLRVWAVGTSTVAAHEVVSPRAMQRGLAAETEARDAMADVRRSLQSVDPRAAVGHLRRARSVPGHARLTGMMDLVGQVGRLTQRGEFAAAWGSGTLKGHTGWIRCVGLSSDGRVAVSGGEDKELRVWDVATGRCMRTLEGHTQSVMGVSITADGRLAVSQGGDGGQQGVRLGCDDGPSPPNAGGADGRGRGRGPELGRSAGDLEEPGRDDADMGRGDGPSPPNAGGADGRGRGRGPELGRSAGGVGGQGQDTAGVGRVDGTLRSNSRWAHGPGAGRRPDAGRTTRGVGGRGQDTAGVGRVDGTLPANDGGAHGPGAGRQPDVGRATRGVGELGQDSAIVGCDDGTLPANDGGAHGRRDGRQLDARCTSRRVGELGQHAACMDARLGGDPA